MSGAGKTEWGKAVAETFNLPFFDIDYYIETKEDKTITQIFSNYGEPYFRRKESEALQNIISENKKPFVVSCGGGTPINPSNLAIMKEHGIVIYLKAKIATLIENLQEQIVERPLLMNGVISPVARLSELYEKRRKIYEQAHHTMIVENLTLKDFEPLILKCVNQNS